MKKQASFLNSTTKIEQQFSPQAKLVLYPGDANEFISTIPDASISLIVTSPPYNIGKEYEKSISIEKYLENQKDIIQNFHRILKDEGSICWQVGNFVKNGEILPLDIFYYNIFKQFDFYLRNRIIWRFGHGLHASKRFSGRYETILWFSKSDRYTFNLDNVRIPSKYPGKRHFKGKNKGKPSGNPKGKNPSDYWEIVQQDWEQEVWDIPNVKSNHPEKTIHPCQYPIELVERCVLALTNEEDYVFDPYSGVGSSLIAALKHNRRAIGSEKEPDYIDATIERINDYFNGKLRIRPLGKPVHVPSGKEKVSQIPDEWEKQEQKTRQLRLFDTIEESNLACFSNSRID
ncbi:MULTISPECIES: site-specific DNA-methyltransferase [Spirulina sp. CCY15215]|uniref:DNA-methyltransferase n=1 Tax=Spirulina sp. CCY15215 TaxID=2767591 RepID=UPI00195032C1|nr:site-specific DNA-methyltransferase [Spirulina major]